MSSRSEAEWVVPFPQLDVKSSLIGTAVIQRILNQHVMAETTALSDVSLNFWNFFKNPGNVSN
jgi:hypothetical protein